MIYRLFPLLCTLALALGSTVSREEDGSTGPGKKKFDDTIVRPDVIDVNKIITTIRDNWHLKDTEEGIHELCKMIMFKYPASESNEVFKAARYPFPIEPSVMSQYLYGTYYICPASMEKDTTKNVNGITSKEFDGKHTIRNHFGPMEKPCDVGAPDVPFIYGFTNSYIDRVEYPNANPSLILNFPYTAQDEVRSLGSVPGLGKEWNDIYVAVGGQLPDVYEYQFIAFPLTKKACPNIKHPARDPSEQSELLSSNEMKGRSLRG